MVTVRRSAVADKALFEEVPLDLIEGRLDQLEVGNSDVVVPAKMIQYTPEGFIKIDGKLYGLSTWSFKQLAGLLGGVNVGTLREAPLGTGKASKYALVSHWLEKQGDTPILLRLKDLGQRDEKTGAEGRVRAMLKTGGKIPFSAKDLLSTLRPWLKRYDMAVQLGNATEKSFHMRTLFREGIGVARPSMERKIHVVPVSGQTPEAERQVKGDLDTHCLGIHWKLSEVGLFGLSGDMVLFRLVCLNGMIGLTEKTGVVSKRLALADESEFRTEVGLGIEKVRERQGELLEKLTVLRDYRLPDAEKELRAYLAAKKVDGMFILNAVAAFKEEPVASRYGVLQAITRAAKKYVVDQRVEFEALAGSYLDNPTF